MGQHFYTSAELDQIMAEIKEHQRKDMLLRIDEILAVLDTTAPAGDQGKQSAGTFIEGKKFAAMAGVQAGAARHMNSYTKIAL